MSKAVLGGTFDHLHDGHKAMLITAFQNAEHVVIGITTDERANESRFRDVISLPKRKYAVRDECKTLRNVFGSDFEITEIDSAEDVVLEIDADYIIMSPEDKVQERVERINEKRRDNGRDTLEGIEAPLVTDCYGEKISSTMISLGKINEHGEKT